MSKHRERKPDDRPENNPLGLGPRDRESSNTGSVEDTSYDAHWDDPYTTGEPRKGPIVEPNRTGAVPRNIAADPDTTSSDEP